MGGNSNLAPLFYQQLHVIYEPFNFRLHKEMQLHSKAKV